MATANLNHPLMKIAHPGIYERNPFNVLNLPVDATAKEIRRRREDIEAAFATGSEAEEFKDILPGDDERKTPTHEEVAELFKQLEDPETRIAYALFWFWPEGIGGAGAGGKRQRIANSNAKFAQPEVIAGWEKEAERTAGTEEGLVARHNLAVFHHMMGLAYELALEKYDRKEVETPSYVNTYWKTAIHWWNEIVGETEFWRYVSDLVSALGEPRVDGLFGSSLCDQFAFAFDQINAELIIDFAKTGRDADAKRQVEYMKISQPDADDVEGVLENAFASFFRQVEAIVKTASDTIQRDPDAGLKQAHSILSGTDTPLRIARIVLGEGHSISKTLFSITFTSVRNCMIAYGNQTKSWEQCLKLMPRLKELALTEEQKRQAEQDEKTLAKNQKDKELHEICWFCKKNKADKDCPKIEMYGEVSYNPGTNRVTWRKGELYIPKCLECERKHQEYRKNEDNRSSASGCAWILLCPTILILLFGGGSEVSLWLSAVGGVLIVTMVCIAMAYGSNDSKRKIEEFDAMLQKYPDYSQLRAQGWKAGSGPSQEEMNEAQNKWFMQAGVVDFMGELHKRRY